jgi:hypothetical protein
MLNNEDIDVTPENFIADLDLLCRRYGVFIAYDHDNQCTAVFSEDLSPAFTSLGWLEIGEPGMTMTSAPSSVWAEHRVSVNLRDGLDEERERSRRKELDQKLIAGEITETEWRCCSAE